MLKVLLSLRKQSTKTGASGIRFAVLYQQDCRTDDAGNPVQCFCFRRIIGSLTPKIIHFHYLIKYFFGSKYPKNVYLILKADALPQSLRLNSLSCRVHN